ncbi:hypothetical protein EVG20_g4047 [Dentipellis fragilis]|uniref:Uncharacterized protein n=1 Tax=Dentipellis fragilis TaxID=205917 RepID=A0A4Y9Z194_9AGAM|nr:hypothetical protein EVG20_g4047 [Dentipellis fragilis]
MGSLRTDVCGRSHTLAADPLSRQSARISPSPHASRAVLDHASPENTAHASFPTRTRYAIGALQSSPDDTSSRHASTSSASSQTSKSSRRIPRARSRSRFVPRSQPVLLLLVTSI